MRRTHIFIVLLCVIASCFAQAGVFDELVTLDCNKVLHVLPNSPGSWNVDVTPFGNMYNFFFEKLKSRIKACKCPNMSDSFFNRMYSNNIEGLLAFFQNTPVDTSCDLQPQPKPGFHYIPPSTCTLDGVTNGEPCLTKIFLPNINATLQLSIAQCPTTEYIPNRVPYFSLTCEGFGCKNIGRPCAIDSDCGSHIYQCYTAGQVGFSHPIVDKFIDIIGLASTNQSCTSSQGVYNAFIKNYMTQFFGMIGVASSPSFCLPRDLSNDASILGIKSTPGTTGAPTTVAPGVLTCNGTAATSYSTVCGGRGSCAPTATNPSIGYCRCYNGMWGYSCDTPITCNGTSSYSSSVCGSSGRCQIVEGYGYPKCFCTNNKMGDNCDQPLACSGIAYNNYTHVCGGRGGCSLNSTGSPTCNCFAGYGGQNCENPLTCSGLNSTDPNVCGGNGKCYEASKDSLQGVCRCNTGLTGEKCDTIITCYGKQFNDTTVCNGRGTCFSKDFCSCNGYVGNECENFKGCNNVTYNDPGVCSGNGSCIIDYGSNTYRCSCKSRFSGANCDIPDTCNGIHWNDTRVCSGNGVCNGNTCICKSAYYGSQCEIFDPKRCNGVLETDPSVCSGRGNCTANAFTTCMGTGFKTGKCSCQYPYTGNNCEKATMCNGVMANDTNVCSKNGPCFAIGAMEPGTGFCQCNNGYGSACENAVTCASPCQNGGKCVTGPNVDANGKCECAIGYYGPQCQWTVVCNNIPFNDASVCNGDGTCTPTLEANSTSVQISAPGKCNCRSKIGKWCELPTPTSGSTITIDNILAWNGILADGTNVLSDDRKNGKVFKINMPTSAVVNPDYVIIARSYCNGEISFLPESPMGMRTVMPKLNGFIQAAYQALSQPRACSSGYTNDIQRVLLQLWNLDPWLFMNSNPTSPTVSVSRYVTATAKYVMDSLGLGKPVIKMPSTCTYETWRTTGKCTLTFNGISTLMRTPMRMHLRVERCNSLEVSEGLPLIELTCQGALCQQIKELKTCDSDSDCTAGVNCVDLYDQFGANTNTSMNADPWTSLILASNSTCTVSKDTTWSDYVEMINYLQGTVQPVRGLFKVCAFDGKNLVNKDSVSKWVNNMVQPDADALSLTGLNVYTGPNLLNPDGNPQTITTTVAPTTAKPNPTGLPDNNNVNLGLAIGLGVGLGVGIPLLLFIVAVVIIAVVVDRVRRKNKVEDDYRKF